MMDGINGSHPVPMIGAVVFRLQMTGMNRTTGPNILVRAKIFQKGFCKWHGLFMGAPALAPAPDGLGLRTVPNGFMFDGLGIMMDRTEDRSCLVAAYRVER